MSFVGGLNDEAGQLAERLGLGLSARGWRVTTAESCTGGGVAEAITRVAGSSAWFEYGFVSYANRAKIALLGVSEASLANCGAVSEVVVRQMVEGALRAAGADLAVAVSGIAGPGGGSPDKPVGTVWFAWATADHTQARCDHFAGDRAAVRQQAVNAALSGLVAMLEEESVPA